jgi:hypothetical protein
VHLDPCEASVDERLLYQGWGKKQTYILAFYAPHIKASGIENAIPLIEDVTCSYTSDSAEEICKRREESQEQVKTAIEQATDKLRKHLDHSVVNDKAVA